MAPSRDQLLAVLDAARVVLERRADQMLTAREWDDLERTTGACGDERAPSSEVFAIDGTDLVRSVVPKRGEPYQHRCPQAAYELVAHAADEATGPFRIDDLQAATKLPFTQVAVALAFLKERGCLQPASKRRQVPATHAVHLDAITEWHALREKPHEG